MLGWLYARALIRSEKLWGGPAPISVVQLDDFILWVTIGIILGGRVGYVLFYNLDSSSTIPPRFSSCGTAACRFTAASWAASRR